MGNFQWTDELVKEFAFNFLPENNGMDKFVSKIEEFKASKQPKPEWDIIEVNHNVRNTRWNINYWGAADWKEKVLDKLELFKICKVKRLSDGEVFTIGDNTQFGKIVKFAISEEFIHVWFDSKSYWQFLSVIKKVEQPKPLFKTEDGEDMFLGNNLWIVDVCSNWLIQKVRCNEHDGTNKTYKYFSTKEAAEQYILENKPCISLKDVLSIPCGYTCDIRSELSKLVQSKLKS